MSKASGFESRPAHQILKGLLIENPGVIGCDDPDPAPNTIFRPIVFSEEHSHWGCCKRRSKSQTVQSSLGRKGRSLLLFTSSSPPPLPPLLKPLTLSPPIV